MTIATTAEKNSLAAKYAADLGFGSIHSGAPGTTGANEIAGTRQPISWGSPTNGVVTGTATFTVPTATTVSGIGLWSAATAGTFGDGVSVTAQSFPTGGQLVVTYTYTQA